MVYFYTLIFYYTLHTHSEGYIIYAQSLVVALPRSTLKMSSGTPSTKKEFPIGSTFVCNLDSSSSYAATVSVAEHVTLFLNTATLAPDCFFCRNEEEATNPMVDLVSLFFASPPECPNPLPLCSFHLKSPQCYTYTSLGIQVTGPREISLKLILLDQTGTPVSEQPEQQIPTTISVNLFGSVEPTSSLNTTSISSSSAAATVVTQLTLRNSVNVATTTTSTNTKYIGFIDALTASEQRSVGSEQKQRLSVGEIQEPSSIPTSNATDTQKGHEEESKKKDASHDKKRSINLETDTSPDRIMSKKARKQLAKLKQEQLADVIQKELEFDCSRESSTSPSIAATTTNTKSKAKVNSDNRKDAKFISQRRLQGGVIVKDVIIGNGIAAKPGRKVSILYVGSLTSNGKVFDKNQNRSKPLQFRVGTGQVIRGLDIGLEGMKVGGERIITIPPELGYGNKSMGDKIPKNSALTFQVRLI
jgi:FKBP-type peptidyl-prolyl cis-trans isomerase